MTRKNENMRREMKALGAAIRFRRLARGLTQVEFAKKVGVSNKQLHHVEAAGNWPSLPVYINVVRALNAGKVPLVDDSTTLR